MAARIREQQLGEIAWIVVTGEREAAFRLLGEHAAERIRVIAGNGPMISELRSQATGNNAARNLTVVGDRSRAVYPEFWAELNAMAEGAEVPVDDLLLLNLRGDLGDEDGTGCTDVAFTTERAAVLAHNEDGAVELHGQNTLLTLMIDGEPAVTVWWYPGFLPANTFVINEHGLVWGMDSIKVAMPAAEPGRHFVGRSLQRCRTITEAADHLRSHPSAGGFAYNIGHVGSPQGTLVEAAAGHYATVGGAGESSLRWHTNHLRRLPEVPDARGESSLARAEVASGWVAPDGDPVDWCLARLAENGVPNGVRSDGTVVTLVTAVVDLLAETVTLAPRGGEAMTLPAADLARGIPDHGRPHR